MKIGVEAHEISCRGVSTTVARAIERGTKLDSIFVVANDRFFLFFQGADTYQKVHEAQWCFRWMVRVRYRTPCGADTITKY